MKILVVFTGGTIGCVRKGEVLSPDNEQKYMLTQMYLDRYGDVDFDTAEPYTVLSENLEGCHMNRLADCLQSYDLNSYDGIVVTHGTDTLQYTSAFLAYIFDGLNVPIVLVSANYPLDDSRSNGFENFVGAIDFIKSGSGNGVFVSYKNADLPVTIHRASRLLAHSAYSDELHSIFDESYGKIQNGIFVKNIRYKALKSEFAFDESVRLSDNSNVLKISATVGMQYPEITENVKAVLLEGFHSGTLNTDGKALNDFCKKAKELNLPVFLTGACKGFYYESKLKFDGLNITVLPPASPIAMYIKLWLLPKSEFDKAFLPCAEDFYDND